MENVLKRAKLALGYIACVLLTVAAWAAGPAMNTVTDTVYRADGTPASGTLLISWPAFTTADGKPVAAGNLSVTIGAGGAVAIPLAPNAGASPDGTFYKVVFKLDDGTTNTENWVVPAGSATTIAAIRSTVVPASVAMQAASRQYVDSALGAKASDTSVVHLSGAETIQGVKQFSTPPAVPVPQQATDAVNKAYVDQAVANVGSGSYVSKAGDAMTGPLTLAADPTAPAQAARKQYVDLQMATKADKVSGLVPVAQLGTGATDNSKCLKGDQSWGACGSSTNATQIQGKNVDATAPAASGQQYVWDNTGAAWKLQSKASVDVRDWGVKCDGTTDDAAALNTMFSSLRTTQQWNAPEIRFPATPGTFCLLGSTVNVKVWYAHLVAYGTAIKCTMNGPCIFVGDATNQNDTLGVVVEGLSFIPGYAGSTSNPVFRDNGQGTKFLNVAAWSGGTGSNRFSAFIENYDDEKQVIDGLRIQGQGTFIRCDATFCGAILYAPGPFSGPTRAGITTITNSDLGMQCGGNGIDWHSGNDLYIGDGNIIQGYAQFAIRVDVSNGYANKLDVHNLYQEVGGCVNPQGGSAGIGQAGIIVQGPYTVTKRGGTGGGKISYFANNGTNKHVFYVVATNASTADSVALPLGYAMSDNATSFTVAWPRITGAQSYKLLATRPTRSYDEYVPYSGVNSLVTMVTDASCAPNAYCAFTYNPAATLGAYNVPQMYGVPYVPILNFWPAPVVLGPASGGYGGSGSAPGMLDSDSMENPVVSARAQYKPFAWSTTRFENGADQSPVPNQIAYNTLGYFNGYTENGFILNGTGEPIQSGSASESGRKGKLNFGGYSWNPTNIIELITCRDSSFSKTLAHVSLRPAADAGDCALGVVGTDIGFLRAKSKWRFYFNALPAGVSDTNAIEMDATGINLPAGSQFKVAGVPVTGGGGGGSVAGANASVQFNDSGVMGGITGFTFNKLTGDLTVPGKISASYIETTAAGAWSVEGSYAAMTAPATGKSKIGFGPSGQLQIAENGATAFVDVAKVGHTHVEADVANLTSDLAAKAAVVHTHAASDIASGTLAAARLPVMGASGASHAAGAVPDPGATAGTTKYLREDGTWVAPPSGGGGAPGGSATQVQFNDAGSFAGNAGFTFDKNTNSLAVAGTVTATSFVSSGTGPWSVEGAYGTLTGPASGKSKIGFGPSGQLQVAENGAASFTDVSKVGHTHGEGDVTGLASDLPKGIQTTKGDLIGYGVAPARLGAGADGQVLMVDSAQTLGVRWANGPGANVNTIGQGYAFLPYLAIPAAAPAASSPVVSTANQVKVVQFTLPFTITVGKMVANVQTVSAGQTFYAGVYDASGNKLLEGSFSCATANGVSFSLGTAVTLAPGTYLYAYSASDTTCAVNTVGSTSTWVNYLTKNATRVAMAANAVSGGAMPATLGTLSYYGASNIVVTMVER